MEAEVDKSINEGSFCNDLWHAQVARAAIHEQTMKGKEA